MMAQYSYRELLGTISEIEDKIDFSELARHVRGLEDKCEEQEAEIDRLKDRIAELEAQA